MLMLLVAFEVHGRIVTQVTTVKMLQKISYTVQILFMVGSYLSCVLVIIYCSLYATFVANLEQ